VKRYRTERKDQQNDRKQMRGPSCFQKTDDRSGFHVKHLASEFIPGSPARNSHKANLREPKPCIE
jgi:hypothetical protein